jgi:hypothetical protein
VSWLSKGHLSFVDVFDRFRLDWSQKELTFPSKELKGMTGWLAGGSARDEPA